MAGVDLKTSFFRKPHVLVLSLLLVVQAVVLYGFSRTELAPVLRPLQECPVRFGAWQLVSESVIEKEVQDVLRADDTLSRIYQQQPAGPIASLFVAYFKTQQTGQAPHSPKNCLPGAGWVPSGSGVVTVPISGTGAPISVNRYVVSRGEDKSVVLYWYQTPTRVIASEYEAKIYLVLDSVRYNRSDTALIRVVSPVVNGNEQAAAAAALDFIQSLFLPLRQFLPS